ncbi:MAG: PAS domain S-box protein [Phycisphaerales bacterium]
MKRLLPDGIRERLFLLIAMALMPLLLLQGWVYYQRFAMRRSEAMETELEVARGVATAFTNYLNDIRRQLGTVGQAIATLTPYTDARAEELLGIVAEQYSTIRGMSWADPKGLVLTSSLPDLIGRDLSGRAYVQKVLAGQSWALGDLMPTGSVTKTPLFIIANAVYDVEGELRGITMAAIDPTRLGERTLASNRPASGAYAIFDSQGQMVYRSPEASLTWEQRGLWRQADPLLRRAMDGYVAQGTAASAITGDRCVAARVPIAGIDWVAGASRPLHVVMGPVWLASAREASLGALITLLAFFTAYRIARTIANPLRRLEQQAQSMSEGRPGPPVESEDPREVRHLRGAILQMTADLVDRAERLRRTELRFRKLFEADLVGTYVTRADGILLDCNDKMVQMLGYDSREEILTHRSTDFYADPDFRHEAVRVLQRDGIFPGREGRLRRKDGKVIHALGFAVLLTDEQTGEQYIQGMAVDITAQKRAEEALREAKEWNEHNAARLNAVLHQMTEGLILFDPAGNLLDMNRAALTIHGFDDASELQRHLDNLPEVFEMYDLQGRLLPLEQWPLSRALRGETFQAVEVRVRCQKTGRTWFASYGGTPVRDHEGNLILAIVTLRDVTAIRETEQKLRDLTGTLESTVARRTAELEQRAAQLQKLAVALSQAEDQERKRLAEILHDELQQQLAAAKFHLGLLGSRIKGDATLQEAVAPVEGLIKEAIAKSRYLSHELSPTILYHGDFGEAIEWLAGQMHAKHGLVIRVDIRGPIEAPSDAIKAFLFRTAREILFNIVKHAQTMEATVRLRRRRNQLRLTIRDKGRGFDQGSLKQLAGFGLLSIRERLELLGGRMKIRSAPGRGSTFRISVPLGDTIPQAEPVQEPPALKQTGEPVPREAGSRIRVLLADDQEVMREGLATLLNEQEDIEVVGQAADGREAVEMAAELHPNVVVMDLAMPMMEGDEATRQIKQRMPETRVVGLSMFDEPGLAERMHQAGAERYVIKTATAEDLFAAVRGGESA